MTGISYEYSQAANPLLSKIEINAFKSSLSEPSTETFDNSANLQLNYKATSPNLLCGFCTISPHTSHQFYNTSTSMAFYVISGSGNTETDHGTIEWNEGTLFVLPCMKYQCTHNSFVYTKLFWINDSPLMKYLGVTPETPKFQQFDFDLNILKKNIAQTFGGNASNRCGLLLGNTETKYSTKTLTHTLWSLLNCIPPNTIQKPHKHNSVAIDFCIECQNDQVYTLIGSEIDNNGDIINPIKVYWESNKVFVTPPGLWHSHHNESNLNAWILPFQDAGLLTHQRILGIEFS